MKVLQLRRVDDVILLLFPPPTRRCLVPGTLTNKPTLGCLFLLDIVPARVITRVFGRAGAI